MIHWMFRCKEVSEKVSRSMDTDPPFLHKMAIEIHLLMCRYCSAFRRQLIMLRNMSRYLDDEPDGSETLSTLSPESKARMKKMLRAS